MKADAVVRARIPAEMKDKAVAALDRMGLSASDLIRLTFLRVAEEGRLPFDVAVPNRATRRAITELEARKGKRFKNADELFEDLGI
ncbi:MAG TPA: type II toxin-antitoxin system RelB/DinJ family antitoxin [Hyphomicrobiales bacterium]|nr:type II toxin-antitoxin system RelB/DinJ family antitoxin [Hyphomicrobiales bacterium]